MGGLALKGHCDQFSTFRVQEEMVRKLYLMKYRYHGFFESILMLMATGEDIVAKVTV
jgi:hypothetical protein